MAEAKIIETKLIWPGRSGWTFGRRVFIKPGLEETHKDRLIRHELVHVDQYEHFGIVGFLARYFGEYCVNLVKFRSHNKAYREISFEVEARRKSRGL